MGVIDKLKKRKKTFFSNFLKFCSDTNGFKQKKYAFLGLIFVIGPHDTQHNDIQHKDTQLKGLLCDAQHK
jgi:hypothetical protein